MGDSQRSVDILTTLAGAAIAAGVVSFLTPLIQQAALRHGAAHLPRSRDVHSGPVPRWGGVAIYAASLAGAAVMLAVLRFWLEGPLPRPDLMTACGLFLGGALLSLMGAWDDLHEVSPGWQLLAQVLCAVLVIPFGIKIEFLTNPLEPGQMIYLGGWAYPVTVLWIVGVTNAVNWIDGLDGLAAGICAIAAMTLALLAAQAGNPVLALMAAVLCGSLLGFLRYNFSPARIFMGGGALFVGFSLASIATVGAFKAATATAIAVPILILGVPVCDSAFVITRRFLAGRPIYLADNSHLHHRLLARGFSQRQTVLILYLLSLSLCVIAFAIH